MQEIICQDPIVASIIGVQKRGQGGYRWFTYVIISECDEGRLIYNTLTCELLLIRLDISNDYIQDQLIARWFMVPEEFDDYSFTKQTKSLRQLVYKSELKNRRNDAIQRFWILTTTYCNANCFYCHEKGIPKTQMTLDVAKKVIEYIKKQGEKKIHIMWYGGEPLVNSPIIDYISEKLLDNEIEVESSMISNGILFDSQMAKKSAQLWGLKDIQITLDGMSTTYNKVKAYFDKSISNPFDIVVENIGFLLNNKVNVRVRLNLDEHNKDELSNLIDYLYSKFGTYRNFTMYSAPLFEECLGTSYKRQLEERRNIYRIHRDLSEKIKKYNVLTRTELPKVLKSQTRCIAVSSVRVIFPDGQFAFCHDYSDGIMSGDIYGNEPSWDERMEYTKVLGDSEKCRRCAKYPQCIRFEKCFDNKCDEELINEWEWVTRNEMFWEYEKKK